jgi:F0F1-type ATP synthase assembly protein I
MVRTDSEKHISLASTSSLSKNGKLGRIKKKKLKGGDKKKEEKKDDKKVEKKEEKKDDKKVEKKDEKKDDKQIYFHLTSSFFLGIFIGIVVFFIVETDID